MPKAVREYSIEDLDQLIEIIKRTDKVTEKEIEERLNYNDGYISQSRSRGKVSEKLINNLKKEVAKYNVDQQSGNPSINDLATAQKLIAEAHLVLAHNNGELTKANRELVEMLKQKPIESASPQIQSTFDSRFLDLLELIAEVGVGKNWKSVQEGISVLSKRFPALQVEKKLKSTPQHSGK